MRKSEILDYNTVYKRRIAKNEELRKIKGYDFLNYQTDLIIKYSASIGNGFSIETKEEPLA
ncbi:hypothetical protein [Lederbergia lenta]|uniref:hypothetical protein n=1 Tax=Lederbergia lenta TaxID=1467 RepID=UPI00203EBE68|nr:hypothetical protein [Lederbergia lenta]MCM3112836.1 hypothetical protein [Lederbergia lenta]